MNEPETGAPEARRRVVVVVRTCEEGDNYRLLVSMDADLFHDPRYLPALIEAVNDTDLSIGSRYRHGVSVVDWSIRRLAVTVMGSTCSPFGKNAVGTIFRSMWTVSTLRMRRA